MVKPVLRRLSSTTIHIPKNSINPNVVHGKSMQSVYVENYSVRATC